MRKRQRKLVIFLLPLLSIEVCLLGWFSKIVKICYNLYVAPKENYEETQHSHSILSKIDGTSAYIAISTQVIHLLEDMNPWERYHQLQCLQMHFYHVHLQLQTAKK